MPRETKPRQQRRNPTVEAKCIRKWHASEERKASLDPPPPKLPEIHPDPDPRHHRAVTLVDQYLNLALSLRLQRLVLNESCNFGRGLRLAP